MNWNVIENAHIHELKLDFIYMCIEIVAMIPSEFVCVCKIKKNRYAVCKLEKSSKLIKFFAL